jgi:hypothetical protein
VQETHEDSRGNVCDPEHESNVPEGVIWTTVVRIEDASVGTAASTLPFEGDASIHRISSACCISTSTLVGYIRPRDHLSQRLDSSEMNPLGPTSLVVVRRTTQGRAGGDGEVHFWFYAFTVMRVLSLWPRVCARKQDMVV